MEIFRTKVWEAESQVALRALLRGGEERTGLHRGFATKGRESEHREVLPLLSLHAAASETCALEPVLHMRGHYNVQ